MSNLLELAERCEKAPGPDREIDATIWWAIDFVRARRAFWNGSAGKPRDVDVLPLGGLGYLSVKTHAPAYTSSIDAALTLVPVQGRWLVGAGKPYNEPWANVRVGIRGPFHIEAVTPALALCAAALRARHALKNDDAPAPEPQRELNSLPASAGRQEIKYPMTQEQNSKTEDERVYRDFAERVNRMTDDGKLPPPNSRQDTASSSVGAIDVRPCTCHPDDSPPSPCTRQYALTECRAEAAVRDIEAQIKWPSSGLCLLLGMEDAQALAEIYRRLTRTAPTSGDRSGEQQAGSKIEIQSTSLESRGSPTVTDGERP